MGVPQRRQRVFFIAKRKDLNFPKLELDFNEKKIPYREIEDELGHRKVTSKQALIYWEQTKKGENFSTVHPRGSLFDTVKVDNNKPLPTITTGSSSNLLHYNKPKYVSEKEIIKAGTFPLDYNFLNSQPVYLVGMSVPPVMTAQIANQIYLQWLDG